MPLEGLPEGTRQNGYEDFSVQDLKIEAHHVCYRRLRYLLPDGTSLTAPLPAPQDEYVWGEDALMYAEFQGLSLELRARLSGAARKGIRILSGDQAWERQLAAWKIRGDEPRRIVTEAALFGTLMHYELYVDQPLVRDDAGQFKISGLLHALCRLHAERSIRKPVPLSPREQEAMDNVRDAVWKYYQVCGLSGKRRRPDARRPWGGTLTGSSAGGPALRT